MKKATAIVLCLLMLFVLSCCAEKRENDPEASAEDTVFTIKAAGLSLKYPEKWRDKVSVEIGEDAVSFSAGQTPLFDLTFNSEQGDILGTVNGEHPVVIRALLHDIPPSDSEMAAMQEDINVILSYLVAEYDFVAGQALTGEESDTFEIQTQVATLHYPLQWKDIVSIQQDGSKVSFLYEEEPVFDLVFEVCDEGALLGTYGDTPIYAVLYPVASDVAQSMQEDINVILSFLETDVLFSAQ